MVQYYFDLENCFITILLSRLFFYYCSSAEETKKWNAETEANKKKKLATPATAQAARVAGNAARPAGNANTARPANVARPAANVVRPARPTAPLPAYVAIRPPAEQNGARRNGDLVGELLQHMRNTYHTGNGAQATVNLYGNLQAVQNIRTRQQNGQVVITSVQPAAAATLTNPGTSAATAPRAGPARGAATAGPARGAAAAGQSVARQPAAPVIYPHLVRPAANPPITTASTHTTRNNQGRPVQAAPHAGTAQPRGRATHRMREVQAARAAASTARPVSHARQNRR